MDEVKSFELREPAVAGAFYPDSEFALNEELERLIPKGRKKKKAIGLIAPHAGYVYSGAIAGEVFASAGIPDKVVLLGPNHTGLGDRAAVMDKGRWALPNGAPSIDGALAEKIIGASGIFTSDAAAHLREHSLEVQLPFLIHERPGIRFVPITVMGLSATLCQEAGSAIADVIRSSGEDILIVASSDMTHYEPQGSAAKKDSLAIDRVRRLDPEGLLEVVSRKEISMCGVIPSAIMLFAARRLGAKKASLVRYATSGDVSGDYDRVVGYAGMIVE